jgi:hypothetical protein
VAIVPNALDTQRFQQRLPLPERPARALVLATSAHRSDVVPIATVCHEQGIELELVGGGFGTETRRPEEVMDRADIVFASGRSALEAMGTGCAVIVWHPTGMGGLVTAGNVDQLRGVNFGVASYVQANDEASIRQALAAYDAADAERVSVRVRSTQSLTAVVDRLELELRAAIDAGPCANVEEDRRWLTDWIAGLSFDRLQAQWRLYDSERRAAALADPVGLHAPFPLAGAIQWVSAAHRGGPVPPFGADAQVHEHDLERSGAGSWGWAMADIGDGRTALVSDGRAAPLEMSIGGTDLVVWFWSHGWSGRARVTIDGITRLVDLYDPAGGFLRVHAAGLEPGSHEVRIEPTGTADQRSAAAQVLVHRAVGVDRPR